MNFSEFLLETKFAKIMNVLRGDVPHVNQLGIMSAQNPLGVEATAKENNHRNRMLLQELRRMNFRSFPINPQWIVGKFGNLEDSFLIPHIDRPVLIGLGSHFGQKAVIWGHKMTGEQGEFIHFEYLESSGSVEPLNTDSYTTIQTRDVVLSSDEASDRTDNFSAKPFPRSGMDKRTGEPATVRKFVIPFFSDDYEKAHYSDDKRSIDKKEESIMLDLSFLSSDLPITPEVNQLVEEIHRKEVDLYTPGKLSRWYWQARGSLEVSLQKLREVLSRV